MIQQQLPQSVPGDKTKSQAEPSVSGHSSPACSRRDAARRIAGAAAASVVIVCRPAAAQVAQKDPKPKQPRAINEPNNSTHISASGVVCKANGPAEGADRVYARVWRDPFPAPPISPIPPGTPFATPNAMGNWNLDGLLSGAQAGGANHIRVWHESWSASGPEVEKTYDAHFSGVAGDCAPNFPVPTSPPMGGQDVNTEAFAISRVDHPGQGTLLMQDDTTPLRATRIKVWASFVDWKDDEGKARDNPTGNNKPGGNGWWSAASQAKQYGILVWQPASCDDEDEVLFTVAASTEGEAEWMPVSGARNIFVQVNGKRAKGNKKHKKHALADDKKPIVLNVTYEYQIEKKEE